MQRNMPTDTSDRGTLIRHSCPKNPVLTELLPGESLAPRDARAREEVLTCPGCGQRVRLRILGNR